MAMAQNHAGKISASGEDMPSSGVHGVPGMPHSSEGAHGLFHYESEGGYSIRSATFANTKRGSTDRQSFLDILAKECSALQCRLAEAYCCEQVHMPPHAAPATTHGREDPPAPPGRPDNGNHNGVFGGSLSLHDIASCTRIESLSRVSVAGSKAVSKLPSADSAPSHDLTSEVVSTGPRVKDNFVGSRHSIDIPEVEGNLRRSLCSSEAAETGPGIVNWNSEESLVRVNSPPSQGLQIQLFTLATAWRQEEQEVERFSHARGDDARREAGGSGYGRESANIRELETSYRSHSKYMVVPYSPQHAVWVFCSILLLGYDTIVIPLDFLSPQETTFTLLMSWVVRIFWTLDVGVSFATGYVDQQGVVVTLPTMVARRYLRHQFAFDSVIVLATWLELIAETRATQLIRNLKLIRFARLLRLKKGREMFVMVSQYVRAENLHVVLSTSRILVIFLVFIHFMACIWYGLSSFSSEIGYPSWSQEEEMEGYAQNLGYRYTYCFHVAISLFFGEHIFQPYNILERLFVIVVLYCSFVGQIWLVSSITTAMTHLEIVKAKRSTMFFKLERFLSFHGISRELELKVQRNAKHALAWQERSTDENTVELIQMITTPLKMDLHREIYGSNLAVHPFFRSVDMLSPACTRAVCHRAVSLHHFEMDDLVFTVLEKPSFGGSISGAHLFVLKGELRYAMPEPSVKSRRNQAVFEVESGMWLSEAVLWTSDWVHCGTLRAVRDCSILAVDAETFQQVMQSWIMHQVVLYAKMFIEALNEDYATDDLTDFGEVTKRLCKGLETCFNQEWRQISGDYLYLLVEDSCRLSVTKHDSMPGLTKMLSNNPFSKTASSRPDGRRNKPNKVDIGSMYQAQRRVSVEVSNLVKPVTTVAVMPAPPGPGPRSSIMGNTLKVPGALD